VDRQNTCIYIHTHSYPHSYIIYRNIVNTHIHICIYVYLYVCKHHLYVNTYTCIHRYVYREEVDTHLEGSRGEGNVKVLTHTHTHTHTCQSSTHQRDMTQSYVWLARDMTQLWYLLYFLKTKGYSHKRDMNQSYVWLDSLKMCDVTWGKEDVT